MGTTLQGWEGNIGSTPEFKEFPNGNKEPRRLLRLNVYFDNSIPDVPVVTKIAADSGPGSSGGTKMQSTTPPCSRKACASPLPAERSWTTGSKMASPIKRSSCRLIVWPFFPIG